MLSSLFNYSVLTTATIEQIFNSYKTKYIKFNDIIASLVNELNLSYKNVVQPMIDLNDRYTFELTILNMDNFHPNEEIRKKVNEINKDMCDLYVEQSLRKDVYQTFNNYYNNNYKVEYEQLNSHQVKFVEKIKLDYIINGLELDDEKYNQFKEYKKQMLKNSNDFSFNIAEIKTSYTYHIDNFKSMPKYWLDAKSINNEYITVTLKYPDYIPIMEYCENRDIKKEMMLGYLNRAKDINSKLLNDNLLLRTRLSSLFNMSYVDYKLQDRMAKDEKTLYNFLNLIKENIQPHLHNDLQKLNKFAKENGFIGETLEQYDMSYYSRLYKEHKLSLNMEELKKLFKTSTVIKGTMKIYQTLLNLTFVNITDSYKYTFWHESVQLFEVIDNLTNKPIGYFYLDLYPRDGKYSHAAVFPFVKRSKTILPVVTMACNFDSSGTLSFDDVETFFHEFGHVMHNICTESIIPELSGTSVERDFVETPSQFFENWCYDYESLQILAPGVDKEIVNKLNQMKTMLNGIHYSRQLVYALVDVKLHNNYNGENYEYVKNIFDETHTEIMSYPPLKDTNTLTSFGHIMGGYDAGYYGYMWSEVYAKLLHNEFKNHMLDPEYGLKLRKCILAPGGTQDSNISMEQFLNRKLDFNDVVDVFIQSIFDDIKLF